MAPEGGYWIFEVWIPELPYLTTTAPIFLIPWPSTRDTPQPRKQASLEAISPKALLLQCIVMLPGMSSSVLARIGVERVFF